MTRNTFKRPLVHLLIAGVSLLAVVSLSQSVLRLWKKQDVVRERQDALTQKKEESVRLKQEFETTQTPEFIERQARQMLGMVKEGETVVIIRPITQSDQSLMAENQDQKLLNWKRWWRLFF